MDFSRLDVIEKKALGTTEYLRYRGHSEVLGRSVTFGVCRFGQQTVVPTEIHIFFHGANGDDRQFIEGEFHIGAAHLIEAQTFSAGAIFILPNIETSFLARTDSTVSVDRYFREEFWPMIELNFSGASIPKYVSGVSMGAFAALNMYISESCFDGVLAISPAMLTFDFFDAAKVSVFQREFGIPDPMMRLVVELFRNAFGTYSCYQENDPIAQLRGRIGREAPSRFIFLSVGDRDELGANQGVDLLGSVLEEARLPFRYHVESGGHDLQTMNRLFMRGLSELTSFKACQELPNLSPAADRFEKEFGSPFP